MRKPRKTSSVIGCELSRQLREPCGCVSSIVEVCPGSLVRVVERWRGKGVESSSRRVNKVLVYRPWTPVHGSVRLRASLAEPSSFPGAREGFGECQQTSFGCFAV